MFEKILWGITLWTLCEGTLVALWPQGAIALTQLLIPSWGKRLAEMRSDDLRKLGGIELIFGLLLGGYLLWAG